MEPCAKKSKWVCPLKQLPDCVLGYLYSEFLTFKELSSLDLVFCKDEVYMSRIMGTLHNDSFESRGVDECSWNWIVSRGYKSRKMILKTALAYKHIDPSMPLDLSKLRELTCHDVYKKKFLSPNGNLMDNVSEYLIVHCISKAINLESLDLRNVCILTDIPLPYLNFSKLMKLKSVAISYSDSTVDLLLNDGNSADGQTRPHDIFSTAAIKDRTLMRIFTQIGPRIESLHLTNAYHISTASIMELAENSGHLKTLKLQGFYATHVTQEALCELVRANHKHLVCLELTDSEAITDAFMSEIIEKCTLPRLQRLVINNCTNVSDKGLLLLGKSNLSETLETLEICGLNRVTPASLQMLAEFQHFKRIALTVFLEDNTVFRTLEKRGVLVDWIPWW